MLKSRIQDRRSSWFWLFHLGYWTGVWGVRELFAAVFLGSAEMTGPAFLFRLAVVAVVTAGLRRVSMRNAWLRRIGVSRFGVLTGGAICLAVVMTLMRHRVEPACRLSPPLGGPGPLAALFLFNMTALLGWTFCYMTFRLIDDHDATFVRELEARAAADRNELKHLQATMDPHFLFNSLSAVMAMKHDPDGVEQVTQALADYLRFTLRETSLWEPLGRELDALENYMAIQDARFGEDLVCTVACERRARQLLVPPMLIQPLVENALKYGADTGPRPLLVQVKVIIRDDVLVVEVANTGRWVPPDGSRGGGLGMRTLRTRLNMLYGSDASVAHKTGEGWVRVSVRLPIDPCASPVPILVSGHEAISP